MSQPCRVCGAPAHTFSRATVLNRYDIEYQRCGDCHFIQTETPYWLDEAYRDAIVPMDVGLVGRNQRFAAITSRALRFLLPDVERSIDYGGGYGMFTRMMRDKGHDFAHVDPFCENLFARGLEAGPTERFGLLTAFEVWEHMAEPQKDIGQMDVYADHWLISTMLVPEPTPLPNQWWYYVLEGGQHVSLWSKRSLEAVASQYNRHLITTNRGLHLLTKKPLNRRLANWILRDRAGFILDRFRRRRSLLQHDFERAVESSRQSHAGIAG